MELKDIKRLGLLEKTETELNFNPFDAIVSDEWNRMIKRDSSADDFRKFAIARAIDQRVNFRSEGNTIWDIVKRYVRVICPDCERVLSYDEGIGAGSHYSFQFPCPCGTMVSLGMDEDGFGVKFKDSLQKQIEKEEKEQEK